MRPIDADALVRRLNEISAEPNYQHENEDWQVGLILAEDAIYDAPTVEAPTWIPCSEGMPSEIGTVIVTLLDEYGEYDVEEEWWTGDMFLNFGESSSGYEVLAWMPIPEPYREDGEA